MGTPSAKNAVCCGDGPLPSEQLSTRSNPSQFQPCHLPVMIAPDLVHPNLTNGTPFRQAYQCLEQGSVTLRREAVLPAGSIPSRARFLRGDACALDVKALGSFDAVIASNVLCRCVAQKTAKFSQTPRRRCIVYQYRVRRMPILTWYTRSIHRQVPGTPVDCFLRTYLVFLHTYLPKGLATSAITTIGSTPIRLVLRTRHMR